MAKLNPKMAANIAASIQDRPAPPGSSGDLRPAVNRPALLRQSEGRRRLEAASLIRLDRIIPDPDQPRKEFSDDAIERLAASMKKRQLQPIRVRWVDAADRYMVIVGERRYRAAIEAGMDSIACIVAADDATPEDILEDQLVENALREDLRPVEQARAYKTLMTARGLSLRQLAEQLRIGHSSIDRSLALLKLPEEIQAKVEAGTIAPNTAYELSKVTDPGEQAELAREAAEGRLRRDDIKERARVRAPRKAPATGDGKPSKRSFPTQAGPRVTLDHKPGLDRPAMLAALREVVAILEAE
jgi:ParB family chromosome partitioning protein